LRPFEQQRSLGRHAQAGANHHAIEISRSKRRCGDLLGRFAEIDQTGGDVISLLTQTLQLRIDIAADQLGRELRMAGEIQQRRIDADGEHRSCCHGAAPTGEVSRRYRPPSNA
jgi:hypothetical protein